MRILQPLLHYFEKKIGHHEQDENRFNFSTFFILPPIIAQLRMGYAHPCWRNYSGTNFSTDANLQDHGGRVHRYPV